MQSVYPQSDHELHMCRDMGWSTGKLYRGSPNAECGLWKSKMYVMNFFFPMLFATLYPIMAPNAMYLYVFWGKALKENFTFYISDNRWKIEKTRVKLT